MNSIIQSKNEVPIGKRGLFFGLLLILLWLPRGLGLDRYVTPDEAAWVGRSAGFYYALVHNDYANTFQHGHPGVTVTWAGTAAYLLKYRALPWEADARVVKNWKNVEPFLRERHRQPIEILQTGRSFMVIGNTLALGLAFLYALNLLGLWPALLGFVIIAFDPFNIALTRLMHLDGMMGSLMFLAVFAYFHYLYRGRKRLDLAVSGFATGLSWLTKSPAIFLIPFVGLITLIESVKSWREEKRFRLTFLWREIWSLGIWLTISLLVFVIGWPAMWVDPFNTVQRMFAQAFTYAAEGHSSVIFFNGHVVEGDPGFSFYPLTFLWRTSPVVLLGIGFSLVAIFKRWGPFDRPTPVRLVIYLIIYILAFSLVMSLGAKKFDRYLIPAYAPLDLLAGLGWYAVLKRVGAGQSLLRKRRVVLLVPVLVIGWQVFPVIQTYPYYLSYYNPSLGGSRRAPQVMMIGWGEGLDQAARYLNQKPGAEQLKVMSHYPDGSFSYFFRGETLELPDEWNSGDANKLSEADYLVLYIHQWQRQRPDPALLDYFSRQVPEYVVKINGLEYAQIYQLNP